MRLEEASELVPSLRDSVPGCEPTPDLRPGLMNPAPSGLESGASKTDSRRRSNPSSVGAAVVDPKSMISSARAKMPGLLGTTRRLWGESQRNQRDHCRRRGSTGRSKPWRAKESETSRVKASIRAPENRAPKTGFGLRLSAKNLKLRSGVPRSCLLI